MAAVDSEIESRNSFLKTINYFSYDKYLESNLWESIKSRLPRVLHCELCGNNEDLIWHHERYDANVLIGDFDLSKPYGKLSRVCKPCHQVIHFDGKRFVKMKECRSRALAIKETTKELQNIARHHIRMKKMLVLKQDDGVKEIFQTIAEEERRQCDLLQKIFEQQKEKIVKSKTEKLKA